MRVGQGYDVHRLTEGRRLIIGGVEIPYEKELLGHSDADVLTHAVMDALLGAAGCGDIGLLFPDSDPAFCGISSMVLLEKVATVIAAKGFKVANIDATVVAQAPKMRPFIEQMQANIREALVKGAKDEEFIAPDAVNVKATTEEGLGFTGTGEGISAMAVCLLV